MNDVYRKQKKQVKGGKRAAQGIFTLCAFIAILAVASITIYMVINGVPIGLLSAIFQETGKVRNKCLL